MFINIVFKLEWSIQGHHIHVHTALEKKSTWAKVGLFKADLDGYVKI